MLLKKNTMLNTLVTSKTRVRLLVKFFVNVANNGHLRGLADEFNESTNAIRKELNNLSEAGYLNKVNVQNKINYKANTNHPLFNTLQKIVFQHLGLDSIVEMILDRMGVVDKIFLIGDYARGIDTGVIEVIVVGPKLNEDYLSQLAIKIEKEIKREVKFTALDFYDGDGLIIFES